MGFAPNSVLPRISGSEVAAEDILRAGRLDLVEFLSECMCDVWESLWVPPCDQRRTNGIGCRFGSFAVKELFSGNVFSGILCSSVEHPVVASSIIVLDDLGFTYKYQG